MEVINEKIEVVPTLKEGFNIGISNFVVLLIATILYLITIWIPYLNVGTTIGMYRLILSLSKGENIQATSIFDKANFSQIGDVFLLMGFEYIGTLVGCIFMLIPGIVIGIAWKYAIYIMLEKKDTPTKCLSVSYSITFGEKWRIFFITLILGIIISLICGLLCLIPFVGIALAVIAVILFMAVSVGVEVAIYKHLSKKII